MDIAKELQQSRFESEKQKLMLNVMFTAGWLECRALRLFKPHGLSTQQFNVLRILRGQHPQAASANLIAARMIDRSSNVSRLIDKLLEKDLVTREENPRDRRGIHVAITKKGMDLLGRIAKEQPDLTTAMDGISEAEAKKASDILDRLRGP